MSRSSILCRQRIKDLLSFNQELDLLTTWTGGVVTKVDVYTSEHYVDPDRWPHLTIPPKARFLSKRARDFSDRLEALLTEHDVTLTSSVPFSSATLESPSSSDVTWLDVRDGQMIDRVVADGWLGVAESYLLGEWTATPLEAFLGVLLQQPLENAASYVLGGINPNRPRHSFGHVRPGELPEGLVELYAGATRATGAALFSSGARTTSTVLVNPAGEQGLLGRIAQRFGGTVEETYPIDETWFSAPDDAERQDLDDAQIRRIELMLDEARVGPGDRVLELPSSGGQLAIQAARRGASVDVLTSDEEHAQAVEARVRSAGVAGGVRVELIEGPVPSPRQWSGKYDVIFSVERMETLGRAGVPHFLKTLDRLLGANGVAVIQSIVSTPAMQQRPWASESLDVVRGYVWPALEYPSLEYVRQTAARETGLQVVAETHMGAHLAATIPLWRAHFASRQRQAAAAGFDIVYRRLWDFQLALHSALVEAGDIDCVQVVLQPK